MWRAISGPNRFSECKQMFGYSVTVLATNSSGVGFCSRNISSKSICFQTFTQFLSMLRSEPS